MRRIDGMLARQTDERILLGLGNLIARDRRRKADFLAYLNEVDLRRLYAKQGYSSLFRFLTEKHCLSESSALKRIQAARLARKFPFLYRDVAEGTFSLSALGRLAPFLTGNNAQRLLRASERKSVREVESLLVAEFPKADVEDRLKKSVSPLGVDRLQIQFTADAAFAADIEKARALLSHRFPQGKLADVLGLALKILIRELEKPAKSVRGDSLGSVPSGLDLANTAPGNIPRGMQSGEIASVLQALQQASLRGSQSRSNLPALSSRRHIPRGIFHEVWARDGARCQHLRPDGTICGETRFLEVDHVHPYALGGGHTRENLRLLCWAHNQLRAEARFGKRPPRERAT